MTTLLRCWIRHLQWAWQLERKLFTQAKKRRWTSATDADPAKPKDTFWLRAGCAAALALGLAPLLLLYDTGFLGQCEMFACALLRHC
jgi:hypothetical protein